MLACPECGCALRFTTTKSGRITCDCQESIDCRARYLFPTGGETEGEAADKFVQKCEQYGYTVALEEKLTAALAANEGCGLITRPAPFEDK